MPGNDLRLLSLDGGGVRGLSSLMILERLMMNVNPEAPPKPCEYFDMIGGTSTGGLIAIMLGRLEMSISESIDAYLSLSEKVFQKKRRRLGVWGNIQGRFDSDALTQAVKDILKKQGLAEDALLKDTPEAKCKVFVCATSKQISKTVCLTSYKSPRGSDDLFDSTKIWEACRATSAASSFFDKITIGRYKEEFVDGATGANNPVMEVWNQAQDIWGPGSLDTKIKCLVSVGTGVPSIKPFEDKLLKIGQTLVAISTETEKTAERFQRDKVELDVTGRYYRFNVSGGLDSVGLEEAKKIDLIAAATRDYVASQDVFKQMKACGDNLSAREYFGQYRIDFSLQGAPLVKQFVARPSDMAKLERTLLPQKQDDKQRLFVLHGLGGMGKTQLAVSFARTFRRRFSAVFWLDGKSEDSIQKSIANSALRVPEGHMPKRSKASSDGGGSTTLDEVVHDFMQWLRRSDNTDWLLIFDNVDKDFQVGTLQENQQVDHDAYDVTRYFSGADHGSILITTRLAKLGQLGDSGRLDTVDRGQSREIFQSRYKRTCDPVQLQDLLDLLGGLPLAISQAATYLQQIRTSLSKYITLYKQQWKSLMKADDKPLHDYAGSIWTTWTISFEAINTRNEPAAKLLLLWANLDNKDLWYELLANTRVVRWSKRQKAEMDFPDWFKQLIRDEPTFNNAIRLLLNYSLVEKLEDLETYATHPVVHQWAFNFQSEEQQRELSVLAITVIGLAVPDPDRKDFSSLQRRLQSHAEVCWALHFRRIEEDTQSRDKPAILIGIFGLGMLYLDQRNYDRSEKLLLRSLRGQEKVYSHGHEAVLLNLNSLGTLYKNKGKSKEAESMYQRALEGFQKLGDKTEFNIASNLGALYTSLGRLTDAEHILEETLKRKYQAFGPDDPSTLFTLHDLGTLYKAQGDLAKAENMFKKALLGREKLLGREHRATLVTVFNLGIMYSAQDKLPKAEKMYKRALEGFKEIGDDLEANKVVYDLGIVYHKQGRLEDAAANFQLASNEYEKLLGKDQLYTIEASQQLEQVREEQRRLADETTTES